MRSYKANECHVVELDKEEWEKLVSNSTFIYKLDPYEALDTIINNKVGPNRYNIRTALCNLSKEDFTFSEGKIYIDVETNDQNEMPSGVVEAIIDTIKKLI